MNEYESNLPVSGLPLDDASFLGPAGAPLYCAPHGENEIDGVVAVPDVTDEDTGLEVTGV